jgi:Protein of unknown function (DUF3987)/Bifunctional DNA primase/polymerase, N-terminal/Primase C terminal 2 (PriCT-2)
MNCNDNSNTNMANPTLVAVLEYAKQGLPVFPCNAMNKSPLTTRGFKDATTDAGQLAMWWTQHPNALIGMPTGQITDRVVIDLDVKHGKDGIARFRELLSANQTSPISTLIISTAGGGQHWVYKWPGLRFKSSTDKIGAGIDTRGDGGYVIVPPSSDHRGQYTVLTDAPIAPLPSWFFTLLTDKGIIEPLDKPNTPTTLKRPPGTRLYTGDVETRIERALQIITPNCSYDDWCKAGMAVHSWDPIKGFEIWDAWSSKGTNYEEGETEDKWASFKNDDTGLGLGSLFFMADELEMNAMPEPRPLPTVDAVEPFNYDLLPLNIAPWVRDIVDRMQCQPDIVAVSAVVAMAALVGRKIGIRPKMRDNWVEVPNLWGAVIARPGMLKTPAISEALTPLRRLEHEESERFKLATEHYNSAVSSWETKKEAAMPQIKTALKGGDADKAEELKSQLPPEPNEPGKKRFIVNDATVEALGEVLRANSNGVLLYRDELSGWLRSLEKENQKDSRAFYLETWNGKYRFVSDRIGRGSIEIEFAIVSILGGIQPGPIQSYMADLDGRGDDGLLQRFQLIVWPDPRSEWRNVDRYPDVIAKNRAFEVYQRLHDLTPQSAMAIKEDGEIPYLHFCADAQDIFNEWRKTLEVRLADGSMSDAMQAHLAKYRKLIPSLALLIHLADDGKACVGALALKKAIGWGRYLETHARRLYASRKDTPVNSAVNLLNKIKQKALSDGFTARDIYRHQWTNLVEPQQVQEAINILMEHGYLLEQHRQAKGRPSTVYRINPIIWKPQPDIQPPKPSKVGGDGASSDTNNQSGSSVSHNSDAGTGDAPPVGVIEPEKDLPEPPKLCVPSNISGDQVTCVNSGSQNPEINPTEVAVVGGTPPPHALTQLPEADCRVTEGVPPPCPTIVSSDSEINDTVLKAIQSGEVYFEAIPADM